MKTEDCAYLRFMRGGLKLSFAIQDVLINVDVRLAVVVNNAV